VPAGIPDMNDVLLQNELEVQDANDLVKSPLDESGGIKREGKALEVRIVL
jgi:hypothetical protein